MTDPGTAAHPRVRPRDATAPDMPVTRTPRPHGRTATDHPTAPPAAPPGTGPDARPRPARLFAGDGPPAVVPAVLPPADRTPAEHDACARAVGCPDLFVLDAPDRAARERVVADIARAAAGRGERVLVLSPDPAAADRLAEAVAGHALKVVRALAPNENPYRPGGAASRLTSPAAGPGRVEQSRREAAAALAGPEAELATLADAAAVVDDLRVLADRFAAAARGRADLLARREGLAATVRAEADTPFAAELDRRRAAHGAATAPLRADLDAAAARRAEKAAALDAARHPAADPAKKSGLFARLWGKSKPPADPAEHDRLVRDLEREVQELSDREAKLRAEADAADRAFAAEWDKLVEAEVTTRRADLDARLEALAADRDDAAGRLALRVKDLDRFGLPAPAQLTPEGVERVAAEAAARRAAAEPRREAVRARLDELNRSGAEAARRHLAETRVVVGTPGSVGADPVYEAVGRDLPAGDPPFGLLVLDHAEELTEGDFDGLAPLAGRWVLAGDVSPPHRPGSNGPVRGRPPEPGLLARLARRLDRAPWVAEADRLVFRLRHLPPEVRRGLTREPVLDRPEVELRFATADDGAVLAEVAFPAGTPVLDAKRFLAAEVGEVLLRPCGHPCWSQPDGRPTACWPAAEAGGGPAGWVDLEAGVRERVVGHFTAAVAFDPAAGWDATAAADWLAARLPADPGRVAALPRPAVHPAHPHRPVPVGH